MPRHRRPSSIRRLMATTPNNPAIEQVAPGLHDDGASIPFRSFIENLPVMFYAVSAAPPHKPIYISPSFEHFGYPLDTWINDTDIWDRVIHPEDRDSVLG